MSLISDKLEIDRETGISQIQVPSIPRTKKNNRTLTMALYPNLDVFTRLGKFQWSDNLGRIQGAKEKIGMGAYATWNLYPESTQLELVLADFSPFLETYTNNVSWDEKRRMPRVHDSKALERIRFPQIEGIMNLNYLGRYVPKDEVPQNDEGRERKPITDDKSLPYCVLAFRPFPYLDDVRRGLIKREEIIGREMIITLQPQIGQQYINLRNFPLSINSITRDSVVSSGIEIEERPFDEETQMWGTPEGIFSKIIKNYHVASQKWLRENPDYQTPKTRRKRK